MTRRERDRGPPRPEVDFPGTERFEIRRRLGSGSFGIVYEARDRERASTVALKWLSHVDAETIHRFKHEFRSLADISHRNLVQLFDLASDGDWWFFTMELVHGVPLPLYLRHEDSDGVDGELRVSHVAPRGGRPLHGGAPALTHDGADVDLDELRRVFSQLAEGVHALHLAGKLHRDLKCQNVLVTPEGRAKLLDFGLVCETRTREPVDIVGTPLYMAPEQCAGAPVDRAADWYALGVMLFRALTGSFPFHGRMYEVLRKKQVDEAPRPSTRASGVPEDLDALCARLLARRPADRPSGAEILAAFGARPTPRVWYRPRAAEVFVGRDAELSALEAAYRDADRAARAVYVHGASGIGKTALVRAFLDGLEERFPETLVLEGRCYERETLPYKALDSVIDSLASHLLRSPDDAVEALVPPHVEDLVRVFPALARVPWLHRAASPLSEAADPQEQRRRAVAGLRALLAELGARRRVVIFVDDLQWGDRDSAAMIAPLLRASDAPRVLWLGTFRTDDAERSPYLVALGVPGRLDETTTLVEVPRLGDGEVRALLAQKLDDGDAERIEELAAELAGSPLLIELIGRHARAGAVWELDLGAVIEAELGRLPSGARALVEVLAVRGRPMTRRRVAAALGTDSLDETALTQLRNSRMIRVEHGDAEELEVYHDRIRETVGRGLGDERERAIHASIARALRHGDDPEALAYHLRAAGALTEAFGHTVEAVTRAERALAFGRAAALLRDAIEIGVATGDGRVGPLWERLGDALRNAGRGAEAAAAYVSAARSAPRGRALALRRRAAEQFLFSGHLDEGHALLRTVLDEVDLGFPEHPVRAVAELLLRRAQVRVRGFDFHERPSTELSEDEALRIDVAWSVSVGLAMIDPVRGGIFQARHLLMALEAGDPRRVARAVAVEVPFSATAGWDQRARTRELRDLGVALVDRVDDPYGRGLLACSSGGAAWLEGRWAEALELEEEALTILRRDCRGVAWELATSSIVLLDVHWRMGRWRALLDRWPAILADASSRGDLLLEIYLRVKFASLRALVDGDPARASREAREALARWRQPSFQLLHLWELFVDVEAKILAGRPDEARDRLRASWSDLARSQLLRLEMYDVTMRDLQARAAVATAATVADPRALLSEARRALGKLDARRAPWARGLAALGRAGIASIEGDREQTVMSLVRAERELEAADMALHVLAARARRAALDEDDDARARHLEAMSAEGLADPEAWLALLAPGRYA